MKLFQLFESKELNSEFIWFQKYITQHDLETQMEIEDGKIVFRVGKKLIKWDEAKAHLVRTKIINNASLSYHYAKTIGKFELGNL